MSPDPVVALLCELDRHHVAVIRHGDRIKLKSQAGALPAHLVERARSLKPALLRVVPDSGARPIVHFRPAGAPENAWATLLGWPGESRANLVAYLHDRWPGAEVRS